MTAMDILEALGQVQEEMLCGCDDIKTTSGSTRKNHRAAAGLLAAAAALLLVFVGGRTFISRSFDTGSSGSMQNISTAESAEISADTAEEEFVLEESETVEMEEESTPESAADADDVAATDSEGETSTSATEPETGTEETQTTTDAQTEALALETLQLGDVYIPGFATSELSDHEYVKWMELVALVQAEIDAALSQEMVETLPVYRFVRAEGFTSDRNQAIGDAGAGQSEQSDDTGLDLSETDSDLLEKLGDYPVITAEEAEELLKQGYYLSWADFSETAIDSSEVTSVELQYLISAETQIYMPYYQFTVVSDGDMVFICCVPAVSSEYLEGTLSGGTVE
ncbi:MAG: hypothetical protein LUG56_07130 [Lachnospiraceae bacterium]|nr:hypothetical protein [Lachnospiraceae bacterium]